MKNKIIISALVVVGIVVALNVWHSVGRAPKPIGQVCTLEAKICPDGSAVGRAGPECAFAACPNEAATPTIGLSLLDSGTLSGVTLRPLAILEDSRCPVGVVCIWAGRVVVQAEVMVGKVMSKLDLTLGQAVSFEGATIELVKVTPEKIPDSAADTYYFEFTVKR